MLLQVPLEICIKVVDHLEHDPEALKSLALVHRSLTDHARKYLFRKIVLGNSLQHSIKKLGAITRTGNIYQRVQKVFIEGKSVVPENLVIYKQRRVKGAKTLSLTEKPSSESDTTEPLILYQQLLICLFKQTKEKLRKISLHVFLDYLRPIDIRLPMAMGFYHVKILQFCLGAVDLPLIRSLKIDMLDPMLVEAFIGNLALNASDNRQSLCSNEVIPFSKLVFLGNLERLETFRYRNFDPIGELRVFQLEAMQKVVSHIQKKLPNLRTLELGVLTKDCLDLTVLRHLKLTSLILGNALVANLVDIIEGNAPTLQNVALFSVGIDCDQDNEHWQSVFSALGKLSVPKKLNLEMLQYRDFKEIHPTFPILRTVYTHDKADIDALRVLIEHVEKRGGSMEIVDRAELQSRKVRMTLPEI